METTTTANIKYGTIASQINIKPHTTDLFTLVPIIQYTISHCKRITMHPRRQEKTLSEKKKNEYQNKT